MGLLCCNRDKQASGGLVMLKKYHDRIRPRSAPLRWLEYRKYRRIIEIEQGHRPLKNSGSIAVGTQGNLIQIRSECRALQAASIGLDKETQVPAPPAVAPLQVGVVEQRWRTRLRPFSFVPAQQQHRMHIHAGFWSWVPGSTRLLYNSATVLAPEK